MSKEEKLDWIYKSANSLVDREEYLLGRKVDKTLEQLNDDEKDKKFVLPTPKNHVEHECIPPSIRDFNKIVQSEQVDLSAKLQEDPLVAIKKREEEARRQFLQNPVQLKKLQDALRKKEGEKQKKKKSKKRCSDASLDQQIKEKLRSLKSGQIGVRTVSKKDAKKEKDDVLNTILMHKFNALKDKLSEDDLKDILSGKISDSDEEKPKKKFKKPDLSESECEGQTRTSRNSSKYYRRKSRSRSKSRSKESNVKSTYRENSDKDNQRTGNSGSRNKRGSSTEDEMHHDRKREKRQADEEQGRLYRKHRSQSRSRTSSRRGDDTHSRENRESNRKDYLQNSKVDKQYTNRKLHRKSISSNDESEDSEPSRSKTNSRKDNSHRREDQEIKSKSYLENKNTKRQYTNRDKDGESTSSSDESSDSDLDKKIMERLKLLREENETRLKMKTASVQEKFDSKKEETHYKYSDSEDEKSQLKSFGLVTSDGKKIALKRREDVKKVDVRPVNKIEETAKPQGKQVKRMTEAEKERLRKEMMRNAKERDREREENVKRYREKDKTEEELASKKYDADLLHTELLKTAKHSSVEQRIKSNLNNIQRSSRHMDQNFSKR